MAEAWGYMCHEGLTGFDEQMDEKIADKSIQTQDGVRMVLLTPVRSEREDFVFDQNDFAVLRK